MKISKNLKTSPNQLGGGQLPSGYDIITFTMHDGDWVKSIKLPAIAKDDAFVIINSDATYSSEVDHSNMLFSSTTVIFKNDQYIFKYIAAYKGWVVYSAPQREQKPKDINSQMVHPTSQTTIVNFYDENRIKKIRLPETAGDRDKVILKSSASCMTIIDDSNVNMPGAMILQSGQQYDFFYIAENAKWQLMHSPDIVYEAKDLSNGVVPALTTPKTIINTSDENYQDKFYFPDNQTPGSRIIINSNYTFDTEIQASGGSYTISKGELVSFKVNADQTWNRETITIDLLLLYSDKAAIRLGEEKVKNLLIESLNTTNEALENSGASFRLRKKDIRQVKAKDNWIDLTWPLMELPKDPIVQGWWKELRVDGIYYEGTEGGACGFTSPELYRIITVGLVDCGTTVMRHEIGHGLNVVDGDASNSYNKGNTLLMTIMAGNEIPYYSTPHRYTPEYGIPLGIVDKVDAVRAMNEAAKNIVAHR
ncbi:hypothetical protein [Xenorhabdus miraniensis]|uniref:Metalloprotease StcE beta-sandwich domain-containing protein n=1 Tax=Xenorhabdus miraniensis TaxID=351674 RepID=A0A2D0JT59_9GAMM|nr:hypothetical protein [Xenorhabdus miraniensis]PHM49516.1 hypothetical protein Xmir_01438 [Xenorhabdus miraniensis]